MIDIVTYVLSKIVVMSMLLVTYIGIHLVTVKKHLFQGSFRLQIVEIPEG